MKNKIVLSAILFVTISLNIFATRYYVDATNGNDNNLGTSFSLAWKTISKVNASTFQGGDSVLFKKGEEWNGALNITSSGNSSQQLVFSSYGTGSKPLINGQGSADTNSEYATIWIRGGVSYVTINGFAITNYDGNDIYDGTEGWRFGILIGEWATTCTGIKILNNEVYHVEGFSNHPTVGAPRGTTLDANIYCQYINAAIGSRLDYLYGTTIDSNYVHDCTCQGINVNAVTNGTNILVEHNSVFNVGNDGIVLQNCTSPLIQLNASINAGNNSGSAQREPGVLGYNGLAVCGIWGGGGSNNVFQYNYCEGTHKIVYDGYAWDCDLGANNYIYQYNYSRESGGGFNLSVTAGGIFRYNFSYNDGKNADYQGFYAGDAGRYNNDFYRDDNQGFTMGGQNGSGNTRNNIFYTNATTDIDYSRYMGTLSNNCFYGHTPVNPGSNAVIANPIFTGGLHIPGKIAPGAFFTINDLRNAVAGFDLKQGSPCINSGQNIANNGGIDFWGNPLYNGTADIGADEFTSGISGIDDATDQRPLILYPNPFNASFNIRIPPEVILKNAVIKIYDVCGKEVKNVLINNNETNIGRGELQRGIYFYSIINNNEKISSGKLVVD